MDHILRSLRKALFIIGMAPFFVWGKSSDTQIECTQSPPSDCTSCLGLEVTPPIRPLLCGSNISLSMAGLYWNAHQDGLAYGINDMGSFSDINLNNTNSFNFYKLFINLNSGTYCELPTKWQLGCRVGIEYNSSHDGWDLGLLWTWYQGRANKAWGLPMFDLTEAILPLQSSFSSNVGTPLSATQVNGNWKLGLNLIDIGLGRDFWASRFLSLHPYIGIRGGYLKQIYKLLQRGNSYTLLNITSPFKNSLQRLNVDPERLSNLGVLTWSFTDKISMKNDFKGAGLRMGLDSSWHFGRGWSVYGNVAGSLLYGRFSISQKESCFSPFLPIFVQSLSTIQDLPKEIRNTKDRFCATKGGLETSLGLEWGAILGQGRYQLKARVGWENQIFFNQNQLWRVNRVDVPFQIVPIEFMSTQGDNVYTQSSGDLSTQGWSLNFVFDF